MMVLQTTNPQWSWLPFRNVNSNSFNTYSILLIWHPDYSLFSKIQSVLVDDIDDHSMEVMLFKNLEVHSKAGDS